MKKLSIIFLISIISFNSYGVLIQAEDSPMHFIKIENLKFSTKYKVETCKYSKMLDKLNCEPMFEKNQYITRTDLKKLANQNLRNAGLALVADFAVPAVLAYIGGMAGLGLGVILYGSEGAAVAAIGFLGGVSGLSLGAGLNFYLAELDPFMHRDISIAYEAAGDMTNNLDDVDAYELNNNTVVVIEDISFEKLTKKLQSQISKKLKTYSNTKTYRIKETKNPSIPWQYIH